MNRKFQYTPNPGFFLFQFGQELLVSQRFVQFLSTGGCQTLQFRPGLVEQFQSLKNTKSIFSICYFQPVINVPA